MDCTSALGSGTPRRVPKQKEFPEVVSFQAPEGTIARCDALREDGETKGAFYRAALEAEIKRRRRGKGK